MLFKKRAPTNAPDSVEEAGNAAKAPDTLITAENDTMPQPEPDLEKSQTPATDNTEYPTGLKLGLILLSVFINVFLVSLDRMIVATAIPKISDDFHSVQDIGWYGAAFLLTTCACQLLYGKLYSTFSVKGTFLTSVILFEIGSAICGAAPTSICLIIGRAIQGIGGAGVFSGGIMIIVFTIPLQKRPAYQGMFGAVFGVSSVVGPLLGGVFTTEVTWRWCFYINLPLGAVALVLSAFLLKIPQRPSTKLPLKAKLAQLDFFGTAFIVPGSICLILALQWGGAKYDWDNGRIIALLVLAFALLIGFSLVQFFFPKTATVPPRLFMQRSILSGAMTSFFNGSQMMLFVYYLPIWFQAIKGYSAVESGIQSLAILLPMVGASILSGVTVRRLGYYTPVLIFGASLITIAAGLLTTLNLDTSKAKWVGYQILYGWGIGCSAQIANIAAQTVLPKHEVPIGTSLMFFFQLLGGAIFIAVGQSVLNTELAKNLADIPGFDPSALQDAGATSLTQVPDSIKEVVLQGYNDALQRVFQVGLIMACLSLLSAAAMEWKSTKHLAEASKKPAGEDMEMAEQHPTPAPTDGKTPVIKTITAAQLPRVEAEEHRQGTANTCDTSDSRTVSVPRSSTELQRKE